MNISRQPIGSGAIAIVFEGTWNGKKIAAKSYVMDVQEQSLLKEFYAESRILLEHKSDYIVKCYGVSVQRKLYEIIMERAGVHVKLSDGKVKELINLRDLINILKNDFPYDLKLVALNNVRIIFYSYFLYINIRIIKNLGD